MNILIDELPTKVSINGEEYEIRTDFRISLLFSLMTEDTEMSEAEKLYQTLHLYFKEEGSIEQFTAEELLIAVEQILWFYRGGKIEQDTKSIDGGPQEQTERILSFEYDHFYIFSSFMQEYKINLAREELHWWEFKALFEGLSHETPIKRIMSYRAMKIDSKMSKEEQTFYRKQKELYRLPRLVSEEQLEYEEKMAQILMGNGDLSKLAE